jgi:uncharacterized protein
MISEHPIPIQTPTNKPFFDRAHDGHLALQTCRDCGGQWFPPSSNCPTCLGEDLEWVNTSGNGRLWSWVVMHRSYGPAFKDEIPYVVAAVQLVEGPLMMSTIVGTPREELQFDAALRVEFTPFGPGAVPMPVFRVVR